MQAKAKGKAKATGAIACTEDERRVEREGAPERRYRDWLGCEITLVQA